MLCASVSVSFFGDCDSISKAFLLKDGTLYPILYRLEDNKLVVGKWSGTVGRQVPGKYYKAGIYVRRRRDGL